VVQSYKQFANLPNALRYFAVSKAVDYIKTLKIMALDIISRPKFVAMAKKAYLCTAFRRNRWREEVLHVMLRWNDKTNLIIKQNGFN
jgi:hypothetical protein